MHARVEFYMYWEVGDALALGSLDEGFEQSEAIDLGFQLVLKECVEAGHFRVHNHDVRRNACTAQLHAFICHRHCQIIHLMILQRLCDFYSPGTIGRGFHHTNHLRLRPHEGTVVVQVVDDRREVYLENRFVHLLHKGIRDAVEAGCTGSLDENDTIAERGKER